MDTGRVTEIIIRPTGDELYGAHVSGQTTITLTDVGDFDIEGQISIEGDIYDYIAKDDTLNTLTIKIGLLHDYPGGDDTVRVDIYPASNEKWGLVQVSNEEDAVWALVPQALYDRLSDGIRSGDEQEPVELEWVNKDNRWEISNVVAVIPSIDAQYISGDSQLDQNPAVALPGTPGVETPYDSIYLDTSLAYSGTMGTFKLDPSEIVAMGWSENTNTFYVIQRRSNGCRVWRYNIDGTLFQDVDGYDIGDQTDWYFMQFVYNESTTLIAWFGLFGPPGANSYLVYDGDVTFYTYDRINSKMSPCLGWDYTNQKYLMAETDNSNRLVVRSVTLVPPGSGGGYGTVRVDSTLTFAAGTGRSTRWTEVWRGSFDYGGDRIVAKQWSSDDGYLVANPTNGAAFNEGEGWSVPSRVLGTTFDGANFYSVHGDGVVRKYQNNIWTDENNTLWAAVTNYDSDTAGTPSAPTFDGTHESTLGPKVSVGLPKRTKFRFTLPDPPDSGGIDDPDKWRLYAVRGGLSAPTDDQFVYQAEGSDATTLDIEDLSVAGDAPPAFNNFPGGEDELLKSSGTNLNGQPTIELQADGSGRAGPASWDADGTWSADYDTGWVSGVTDEPGSGFTVVNSKIRRLGNMAELRIIGSNTSSKSFGASDGGITDIVIGHLPVGFIPANIAGGQIRIEGLFGPRGALFTIGSGGNISLVSIDGYGTSPTYAVGSELSCSKTYFID